MLHVFYFSFRWGPFVHFLGIVQWNSTRRDHPGNPGGVFGSGPVKFPPPSSVISLPVGTLPIFVLGGGGGGCGWCSGFS